MKKTILYIAASSICLGLMLANCSKKADPAPAATTSTTGTTTSGTTAGSTTSSTTAGSITSSTTTTSGTTTSTTGSAVGGSGTLSVNGITNILSFLLKEKRNTVVTTLCQDENYTVNMTFGDTDFASGNYLVVSNTTLPQTLQVGIGVGNSKTGNQYYSTVSNTEKVIVSGKNVKFSNIVLKNINNSSTISVSGNYTFKE